MTTKNSIKAKIVLFGSFLCIFFMAQLYVIVDPHHITSLGLVHYEKVMDQEAILKDLVNIMDRRHELTQNLLDETDDGTLDTLTEIQETVRSHEEQLKTIGTTEEWRSAYKTLLEVQKTYDAQMEKLLLHLKSFATLKRALLTKSIKPIINILEESKPLARTPQENASLNSLLESISSVDTNLRRVIEKKSYRNGDFDPLNKPMEAITAPLSLLLQTSDSKPELHAEIERLQTLLMNYFSSIHQIKNHLLERAKLIQALEPQENALSSFIHELTLGLKESQKEIFQDIYEESRSLKKYSLVFSVFTLLLMTAFLMLLFFKIQRPLEKLSHLLRFGDPKKNLGDSLKSNLEEIQDILCALDDIKIQIWKDIQKSSQESFFQDNQKIQSKLEMLANSAIELGKVSSNIAKIPKIFDQKFSSIYTANDEARTHFRQMVYACEGMKKTMGDLVEKVEVPHGVITREDLMPLTDSITHILSQAHEAAIEAQTLGLRFNSLVRTKDDTIEVSKLFSKAGTRVNQLARSLKEDVNQFFERMQDPSSNTEVSRSSEEPKP